jgi:hypothetical protein
MPVVEFTLLEIAGAAERNSAGMTKQLPLPLRRLYRDRGVSAVNAFAGNKDAVDEVKSQGHEVSDFGHRCRFAARLLIAPRPALDAMPFRLIWILRPICKSLPAYNRQGSAEKMTGGE